MSDCLEMAFTNLLPTSKAIHHFTRPILDHFKSPGATGAQKNENNVFRRWPDFEQQLADGTDESTLQAHIARCRATSST